MAETFRSDLAARLRARRPTLTAAGQRLVDLLLDDLGAASRLTISELSSRVDISESSVVRVSRGLGFGGYPELRLALAAASAPAANDRDTIVGDITRDDDLDDVLDKLAHQETAALAQTAAGVDRGELGAVVDAIAEAGRIDIYGVAASGLVAMDLAQKLQRLGLAGQAHADRHLAVTSAALLGAGDVAVGISHSGATPDVLEPLRQAARAGATTATITSHPRAAIGRTVDHVLVCAGSEERAFRPGATASRISQLLLVDAVFVGVAQRRFESAAAALQTTRQAVADLDPVRRS